MRRRNLLALGPAQGWHADQLRAAATRHGRTLQYADYETLRGVIDDSGTVRVTCAAGDLSRFDAVLCRTMPMGTMEQIIFRLASLNVALSGGTRVTNPPKTLEIAIDKYATLGIVASLGIPVPVTMVAQSRADAMDAYDSLGGDVVVKPIFGGEGRGVMRVRDRQLAWTVFSTLEQLGAIHYVQKFVRPGGQDTRLLIIGDEVHAVRRTANNDFRTNVAEGASCESVEVTDDQRAMATRVAHAIGLRIGSIDVLDNDDGPPLVLEVNGVPGWKGAQQCVSFNIAERMIAELIRPVHANATHRRGEGSARSPFPRLGSNLPEGE